MKSSKCVSGYFQDDFNDSVCTQCPQNCYKCNSSLKCERCSFAYYLGKDGLCHNCSENCLVCFNPFTCVFCSKGFLLLESSCISKLELKTFSENTHSYYAIYPKYSASEILITTHQNMLQIDKAKFNSCLLVSVEGVCLTCRPGYFRENNSCSECSPGCLKCDIYNHCLQCGFYYSIIKQNGLIFCEVNTFL